MIPDKNDLATVHEERLREEALARQAANARPSHPPSEYCIGYGDPIPPERRAAIPAACRCIECKTAEERREQRHARSQ